VIGKGTPRVCEGAFVLIHMAYLYFFIAGESFHEREDFMNGTRINDLVDEGSGEIIFGTSLV
jgi:hypothetical protein